jgi:hypothetical protein
VLVVDPDPAVLLEPLDAVDELDGVAVPVLPLAPVPEPDDPALDVEPEPETVPLPPLLPASCAACVSLSTAAEYVVVAFSNAAMSVACASSAEVRAASSWDRVSADAA